MIKIISARITLVELNEFLGKPFTDMIKFVADLEKGVLALGGELHSDAEEILLGAGSAQRNLWGGNFYPQRSGDNRIEYTALINIRPSAGNNAMEVKDKTVKTKMEEIVGRLLP